MDYVHLTFGSAVVIVRALASPDSASVAPTENLYLFVDDVAGHYEQAKAAGAVIVTEPRSPQGTGRQSYSCRDPEGYVWSFGTINPWKIASEPVVDASAAIDTETDATPALADAEPTHKAPASADPSSTRITWPEVTLRRGRLPAMARALAASALVGAVLGAAVVTTTFYVSTPSLGKLIAAEQRRRADSEQSAQRAQQELAGVRSANESFKRAARLTQSELVALQSERSALIQQIEVARTDHGSIARRLQNAEADKATLQTQIATSTAQLLRAEERLAEETADAKAAAEKTQLERTSVEAAMEKRALVFEASLRDAKTKIADADAIKSKAEADLDQARKDQQQAELSLATAILQLDKERQARIVAEREAADLRTKLAAAPPPPEVAKPMPVAPLDAPPRKKSMDKSVFPAAAPVNTRRAVPTKSSSIQDLW